MTNQIFGVTVRCPVCGKFMKQTKDEYGIVIGGKCKDHTELKA